GRVRSGGRKPQAIADCFRPGVCVMKILIAEDERMSCRQLEKSLSDWGHEVVVACDGEEAWAALQGPDSPQLAILDWMMPVIDGVEICRRLREVPALRSIYVILLTAKTEVDDLVVGLDAGASDYLTKPFKREELRARLEVGVRMVELQRELNDDRAGRKRAEEALRISEEQLRQAQKMEAIGQLAGGIAHDFNNLLTTISGYCQLSLRRLKQGEPLHRNIEEIMKAGERAALLTRQLLAFSRRQILQPRVLNLNSLVTDLSKRLRSLIPENIEFITVLGPEAGQLNADPSQIEQVLMNLVVNAGEAMPHGGKLVIETASVDPEEVVGGKFVSGPHVMLIISDTGCGMDAETQERIFEPFFTTKKGNKGTGLGLATVYGIIKQSGGAVRVESEVGRGTTFKIYLPQHVTADEVGANLPAPAPMPPGTSASTDHCLRKSATAPLTF
ncbi:MAG TPA: response regulator, partial [Pyrinomonadaceae bacterium]|nr:response regulator [Pyrinomonadaceae bacterium]